ncbi:helix-turn-helix protein [Salsuginibacillus halophilus]|uniref:Helix-turn-helix protein n=1 Tax=Salsuginibacillus halophilus TaxID=517424 RepID=A0A2P8H6B8_9BACI|nr:helix-turn-helix transcriptional regulator [Salsuginibacillus halophilus]PSL41749.1 helix-turn-helix protein [Salsuginibacillus halophilus]
MQKPLHETVKEVRQQRGIPQAVIARKLGITRQSYASKEAGKSPFYAEDISTLAESLVVEPAYFFEKELTNS